jgi:predicted hydrolase (HD superfamily)
MNVDEARQLMESWVASPALRVHMEAVAACMRAYSERLDPAQADRWTVCGLLHDFDYEKHPTRDEHPFVGVRHLESLGVDAEILTAILGHADYCGTPRETPMAKTLFAVDELAGFIVACAKVRPDGIASLEARSVKKKLKDKAFAAAVSRADIAMGVTELAPLFSQAPEAFEPIHVQACIDAIRGQAARLGV